VGVAGGDATVGAARAARGLVVVVGLGPAGLDLLTAAAVQAIERVPRRFLRTARHPSAVAVPSAATFDSLYERAGTLDEVYAGIVDALVEAAAEEGEVLYAVPGSPLVSERTVELLIAGGRVDVELVPGLSFLDLAWARLGVDPITTGVRLVDGHRFGVEAAGERGPLIVAQCDSRAVLSEVKLAVEGEPPDEVVVLRHLGLADETVSSVEWAELDRQVDADHLTTLYVPSLAAPVAGEVSRFAELVRTLRARCPWDREQTHQTLTRHLLEETYEVLDAIEGVSGELSDGAGGGAGEAAAEAYEHLEEELGDLLFQVVFHATLAAEEGQFTLADVARRVHDKLVGRHPHVFGDVQAETAGAVMRNWEHIKQAEKGAASLMDGIPGHLPSLLYAHKVQRKAASVGIEAGAGGGDLAAALARAQAEPGHAQLGELLFEVVNLARSAGIDPEAALRATTVAFRERFKALEALAAARVIDLRSAGGEVMGRLWAEARPAPEGLEAGARGAGAQANSAASA
jgi:tetrapyrrole methylase family protein/MazG family protein